MLGLKVSDKSFYFTILKEKGDDGLVLGMKMAAEELHEDFSGVIKDHFCIVFLDEEHILCEFEILEMGQREGTDDCKFHGVARTLVWFAQGNIAGGFIEFLFHFKSFWNEDVEIDIFDERKS